MRRSNSFFEITANSNTTLLSGGLLITQRAQQSNRATATIVIAGCLFFNPLQKILDNLVAPTAEGAIVLEVTHHAGKVVRLATIEEQAPFVEEPAAFLRCTPGHDAICRIQNSRS